MSGVLGSAAEHAAAVRGHRSTGEDVMAKKKIAIVGAGAVGGYAGAHMVQAGEDVTYIDPWPENVEAIRKDGLRVTHIRDVEPFTATPRALPLTQAPPLA